MTGTDTRDKLRGLVLATLMVLSVFGGTIAFSGTTAASAHSNSEISVTVNGSTSYNLTAGSADQSLGLVRLTDISSDAAFSTETTVTLPSGVSINETASSIVIDTNKSNNLQIDSFSVENNGQELVIDHSGVSAQNESIRIKGLSVDVSTDVSASFAGTTANINVDYFLGNLDAGVLDVYKPQVSTSGTSEVPVSSNNQDIGTLNISTNGTDGQIGDNTFVEISIPGSGVTFDTSLSKGDLVKGSTDSYVNDSAAEFVNSGNKLRIPVTQDIAAGVTLNITGLAINTSGSASDTNVTVTVSPAQATGTVTAEESFSSTYIDIQKPTVTLTSQQLAIGKDNQSINSGNEAFNISSPVDGSIGNETNVTFSLNNSAVTFDTRANPVATAWNGSNSSVGIDDNATVIDVTSSQITVKFINNSTDVGLGKGDFINVTNVALNVTNTPVNQTEVAVEAVTKSSPSSTSVTSTSSQTFTLVKPGVSYSGDSVDVDNDGETNESLANNITVTTQLDRQIANDTNVTLKLSGTGATFTENNPVTVSGNFDPAVVNEKNITAQATQDNNGVTTVNFSNVALNLTAVAGNVTFTVETNTGNSTVTIDVPSQVTVSESTPGNISADGNISDGTTTIAGNVTNSTTVGSEVTGVVRVNDTTGAEPFGDAEVSLEIVSSPNGSSGASVESPVTTNSSGFATFNFTAGDTTGNYTVTATTSSGATVNITYTASAGQAAAISVSPIENAIADRSGEIGNATLWVNATDEFGNPVSSNITVSLTSGNAGDEELDAYNTTGANGAASGFNDNLTDGSYTIYNGTSVIVVDSATAKDVTIDVEYGSAQDTGTVQVFEQIATVSLDLNESTVTRNDNVNATATILESDGTTIEVPDVVVNFDDNSNTNTSFVNGGNNATTRTTGSSGQASVVISTDAAGTSTIDATSNLKKGSATLTIEQPTLGISLNTTEVTVDSTETINASVTYTNNDTAAQGVTINVTGAGVSVNNQTTLANGAANFSVSPTETGTITVTATQAGSQTVSATIDVVEAGPVSISADPATENVTSTHSISATVRSESSGDSLNSIQVDYSVGANAADVSNVGQGDVTVTVAGQNVTDDLSGVSASNNGETLTLSFGGNYSLGLNETVSVTLDNVQNPSASGDYNVDITLNHQSDPTFTQTANLSIEAAQSTFEVSNLDAPSSVTQGENVTVNVTITNTGNAEGTQDVEYRFNGSVAATEENVTLAGGASTTIEFTYQTDQTAADTYTHGVYTNDDNQTAQITVDSAAVFDQPIGDLDSPPKDGDGDGKYEDVNGDGTPEFQDAVDLALAVSGGDDLNLTDDQIDALDFDNDGDVDFDDAVQLALDLSGPSSVSTVDPATLV